MALVPATTSINDLTEDLRNYLQRTWAHQEQIMEGKKELMSHPGELKSIHEVLVETLINNGVLPDQPIMTIIASLEKLQGHEPLFIQFREEWIQLRRALYTANAQRIIGTKSLWPDRFENTMSLLTFNTVFDDKHNHYWQLASPMVRGNINAYPTLVTPEVAGVTSTSAVVNRERKLDASVITKKTVQRMDQTSIRAIDQISVAWLRLQEMLAHSYAIQCDNAMKIQTSVAALEMNISRSMDLHDWPITADDTSVKRFYHEHLRCTAQPEDMAAALVKQARSVLGTSISECKTATDIQTLLVALKEDITRRGGDASTRRAWMDHKTGGVRDRISKEYRVYCQYRVLVDQSETMQLCAGGFNDLNSLRSLKHYKETLSKIITTTDAVAAGYAHGVADTRRRDLNVDRATEIGNLLLTVWDAVANEDAIRYQYTLISTIGAEIDKLKKVALTAHTNMNGGGGIMGGLRSLIGLSSSSTTTTVEDTSLSAGYEAAVKQRVFEVLNEDSGVINMKSIRHARELLINDHNAMTQKHNSERQHLIKQFDEHCKGIRAGLSAIGKFHLEIHNLAVSANNSLSEQMLKTGMIRWATNESAYWSFGKYALGATPRLARLQRVYEPHEPKETHPLLSSWCQIAIDTITANTHKDVELSHILKGLAPVIQTYYLYDLTFGS